MCEDIVLPISNNRIKNDVGSPQRPAGEGRKRKNKNQALLKSTYNGGVPTDVGIIPWEVPAKILRNKT